MFEDHKIFTDAGFSLGTDGNKKHRNFLGLSM